MGSLAHYFASISQLPNDPEAIIRAIREANKSTDWLLESQQKAEKPKAYTGLVTIVTEMLLGVW